MSRDSSKRSDAVAEEITRQLGSPGMVRYMNALPSFEVQPRLPARLRSLLAELHRSEDGRRYLRQGR